MTPPWSQSKQLDCKQHSSTFSPFSWYAQLVFSVGGSATEGHTNTPSIHHPKMSCNSVSGAKSLAISVPCSIWALAFLSSCSTTDARVRRVYLCCSSFLHVL